ADARQGRAEQRRRGEAGGGEDEAGVRRALADAQLRQAGAGGRLLEGDGRRRVHGQPADGGIYGGDSVRRGARRAAGGGLPGTDAARGRDDGAGHHVAVPHRRDPEERQARDVRKAALAASFFFVYFFFVFEAVFAAGSFGASSDGTLCGLIVPLAWTKFQLL